MRDGKLWEKINKTKMGGTNKIWKQKLQGYFSSPPQKTYTPKTYTQKTYTLKTYWPRRPTPWRPIYPSFFQVRV